MSLNILGISCFFHDSAASIICDGKITAAVQEERFSRIKNDPNFPILSINYCLEEAGISEEDLDVIVFHEKTHLALDRVLSEVKKRNTNFALKQFDKIVDRWTSGRLYPEKLIHNMLPNFKGKIQFIEHHYSHASSAFYPSPFNEAAIITVDGVGEWTTSTISHGIDRKIKLIKSMDYPNSVGLFYSAATYFLGFKINSGEYKVMGLAPYGKPIYSEIIKENIIKIYEDGSIKLSPTYFDFSGLNPMCTNKWSELFKIERRLPETELNKFHFDIAASVQLIVEEIMIKISLEAKKLTNSSYLCISGGVGLNCVANGKILKAGIFKDVWIQPASGDAGNSLGAALAYWNNIKVDTKYLNKNSDLMLNSKLGPSYTKNEVIDFLEMYNFPYEILDEQTSIKKISKMIEEGKIIGLFDGRMEFGPRALGSRSIIGDPRNKEMQKYMNLKIKFRESFRPFAPVILEEEVSNWFDINRPNRYMSIVTNIIDKKRFDINNNTINSNNLFDRLNIQRSEISAVTHVDYSARIQTIPKKPETKLRLILEEFYKNTNVPVLINTSFNLRSEPIVLSPLDAYRCMMRSKIDCLFIEGLIIERIKQPKWYEINDWRESFEPD